MLGARTTALKKIIWDPVGIAKVWMALGMQPKLGVGLAMCTTGEQLCTSVAQLNVVAPPSLPHPRPLALLQVVISTSCRLVDTALIGATPIQRDMTMFQAQRVDAWQDAKRYCQAQPAST